MTTKARSSARKTSAQRTRTPAQIKAYSNFIDKITCDEIFRELVIQDPKSLLERFDLAEDDLSAIKTAPAWAWLRALWKTPEGW